MVINAYYKIVRVYYMYMNIGSGSLDYAVVEYYA